MKGIGEVEFEYIFLKDANIGMCTGCMSCMAHGEDTCPLKDDDLAQIREKMLGAHGLILSSPIHARGVTGLMKNFIDRLAYTIGRPMFFHQKALLVLNSGGGRGKGDFAALGFAVNGARIVHRLYVLTPWYPLREKALRRNDKAIRLGAEKLFRTCLDTNLPAPGILDYLMFRFSKAYNMRESVHLPACSEYYRGKEYYYETGISPIARLSVGVLLPIFMMAVKDLLPADEGETHKAARPDS